MTLRVLLVSQQVRSVRSGVGTYARVLLQGLRGADHACSVATWTEERDPERFPGVRWHSLGSAPRLDPTPGAFWSLGRRVSRLLRRTDERFDVVHFLDAREAHATLRLPVPARWIGTVHDDYAAHAPRAPWGLRGRAADPWRRWLYYAWLRRLEQATYPRFHRLLANSAATGESLLRCYGMAPDRVQTVPLCAPLSPEAGVADLEGAPALLFAGGNYYRKGLDVCIRALPRILQRYEHARLHVAGSDPAGKEIRALARRLSVLDRVHFWGGVAPGRLAAMMRGAAMFLLPARREALGLVYLEAFAARCPVVACGEGGVADLVADGASGLVVPVEDPAALAGAVVRLAGDESLRRRLAEGGERVAAARTPARLLDATLAAYAGGAAAPEPSSRAATTQ